MAIFEMPKYVAYLKILLVVQNNTSVICITDMKFRKPRDVDVMCTFSIFYNVLYSCSTNWGGNCHWFDLDNAFLWHTHSYQSDYLNLEYESEPSRYTLELNKLVNPLEFSVQGVCFWITLVSQSHEIQTKPTSFELHRCNHWFNDNKGISLKVTALYNYVKCF